MFPASVKISEYNTVDFPAVGVGLPFLTAVNDWNEIKF